MELISTCPACFLSQGCDITEENSKIISFIFVFCRWCLTSNICTLPVEAKWGHQIPWDELWEMMGYQLISGNGFSVLCNTTFCKENLWIASRSIWFDQTRPWNSTGDPASTAASRLLANMDQPHMIHQPKCNHDYKFFQDTHKITTLLISRKKYRNQQPNSQNIVYKHLFSFI